MQIMKRLSRCSLLSLLALLTNSCFIDGQITGFGIWFFCFIGGFILLFIFAAIYDGRTEKKRKAEEEAKSIADKAEDDSILSELIAKYGKPDKIILFSDNRIKNSFMVFSNAKNIYASTQIIPFQQLTDCEITDELGTRYHLTTEGVIGSGNGKIIGRSIAGGLIAGPTGAIIGGLSADKDSNKPTSYQTSTHHYFAVLSLSDLNNPIVKVDCGIDGREGAEEIRAIVMNIASKYNNPSSLSIADELNKLSALLEQGVISQTEFDKLKEKLLKA